jgi:3',5'-cyclic AMP phosphodiesterase CpdA
MNRNSEGGVPGRPVVGFKAGLVELAPPQGSSRASTARAPWRLPTNPQPWRAPAFARVWQALRISATLALATCWGADTAGAAPAQRARDYTFILCSDIHLGAENLKVDPPFTKGDTLARVRARLDTMRGWVGATYPDAPALAGLRLGTVAPPRGIIILGDLTDGHKEPALQQEQWQTFDGLFPVKGVSLGNRLVPVFACAGNHDGALAGPLRQGLINRNRAFDRAGQLAAIATNGVHFALNWDGVHFVSLGLCPADTTDTETPFKYGQPGTGSWNDPQGALSFLKDYLARQVGTSGEPVILMHHYGFDGFSLNDWNWWTPRQRRALYDLLKSYNVAAILHGHNHHAEHYRWPDPKLHATDIGCFFDGKPPANHRQYDVLSCGSVGWLIRIRGNQLLAAHLTGSAWPTDSADYFVKSLKP